MANFALFDLVGKQLSPRIRDLGKITLCRPGPRADYVDRYSYAGPLLTRRLQTDRILGPSAGMTCCGSRPRCTAGMPPPR